MIHRVNSEEHSEQIRREARDISRKRAEAKYLEGMEFVVSDPQAPHFDLVGTVFGVEVHDEGDYTYTLSFSDYDFNCYSYHESVLTPHLVFRG